jgi:hypothetical protein
MSVRRKTTPESLSAGKIVSVTGAPLWTPMPQSDTGDLTVA